MTQQSEVSFSRITQETSPLLVAEISVYSVISIFIVVTNKHCQPYFYRSDITKICVILHSLLMSCSV